MIQQCICTTLLLATLVNGALRSGGAPRITEHPSDMTVARNDPVTLKCSADGNPAPVIEWYRDAGELVISSSPTSGSGGGSGGSSSSSSGGHRIMLPGGDLFFFRVILSRKESDAGVYWCTARNALGVSRSRNATLTVAYLHSDFRTAPVHTRGILGESATLECEPPRGHPEPSVIWKKDGQIVEAASSIATRIRLEENGNLYFAKLTSEDEGRYQCLAQNAVGTRETPVALLSVHVRPVIVRPPQDSVALIGGEATLECGVKGDPPPHVEWRRQDGTKMPAERLKPVEGSKTSLRLVRLVPADSGRYVCEAENSVGSSSASAQLTILIPPSWNSSVPSISGQLLPREMRVNLDQSVYIDCPVQGSPAPLVFWRRDGHGRPNSQLELITPSDGRAHRRWSVFQNGTLLISRVRRDDAGSVWCGAVSEAGSLMARTRLDVVAVSTPAPPVIEYGPMNQTAPRGSTVYFTCSATDPLPVRWHKDGQPLATQTDRIKLDKENGGALRIDHLQQSDEGHYTCWVGKDELTSGWTASLSVANETLESRPISRRAPLVDPLAVPGSPSQPRLLERTSNSLSFAWQNGSRVGHSPLLGYLVEVFSSSDDLSNKSWTWALAAARQQHSWRIVQRHLSDDKFTLTDLQPATSYAVLVRAENSHGLSLPSLVSPWFSTLPANDDADGADSEPCSSPAQLLHLDNVRPLNATSARLNWRWLDSSFGDDFNGPASSIGGAYIFYRSTSKRRNETFAPFRAEIVHRASHINSFTVTNLVASHRYSFFMVPFCRRVEGRPSNSLSLSMPEAAPDGPPRDLYIRQLNLTSCLVKWSEPLIHQQNGVITGYQIYVMAAEFETLLANMTLPASPTSVIIGNLVAGSTYLIRAAAWTSAGLGPPTDAASFAMQASSFPHNTLTPPADDLYNYSDEIYPNSEKGDRSDIATNIVQEKWFILAIGGVILAILTLVVVALFVRRYWWKSKSMPSVQKSELYGNNAETFSGNSVPRDLWVRERRSGNESKYTYKFDSSEKKDPEAQSSLLPQERFGMVPPPEYAELLNQNDSKLGESDFGLASFLPVQQQYEVSKSFSQPSAYATTTLINASPREPYYQHSSSSSERSKISVAMSPKLRADYHHQRAPNLNDFLPLPPRYPPPPNAGVFAETSEDDGSLPMPRKSPYKFSSAAPSPALSKRSAPATPSSLSSRANRLNQSDEAKRYPRHQSKAHCSSFNKLEEPYPKRVVDHSVDSDGYQYGRFREAVPSHAEDNQIESLVPAAYEMQEAVHRNAPDLPLRSPRCRLK